jgi:hypothetical protein
VVALAADPRLCDRGSQRRRFVPALIRQHCQSVSERAARSCGAIRPSVCAAYVHFGRSSRREPAWRLAPAPHVPRHARSSRGAKTSACERTCPTVKGTRAKNRPSREPPPPSPLFGADVGGPQQSRHVSATLYYHRMQNVSRSWGAPPGVAGIGAPPGGSGEKRAYVRRSNP